jgi:hypothetical protein
MSDQNQGSTWASVMAIIAVVGAMGALYLPLAFR